MGKEYFELIRVALEQKGLTLVGSLARVIILLPERGRANVLVRRADGEQDTATIFLSQDGNPTVLLSGELDDVPRLKVNSDVVKQNLGIGRRKR